MRSTIAKATGLTAIAVAAVAAMVTPASADPPAGQTPAITDIVGVGSDTTEFVLQGLSDAYNPAHPRPADWLYSWNATGSAKIKPKEGCAEIDRPNGSGAGIKALLADTQGCIDFARSSSPRGTEPATVGFLPFASDFLTYAVATETNVPLNLGKDQLKAIYTCTLTTLDQIDPDLPAEAIAPKIPQPNSGTRKVFLAALDNITPGTCVTEVQEHDPNAVAGQPDALAPFSLARFNTLPDPKPIQVADSSDPATFNIYRELYNVVKLDASGAIPEKLAGVFGPDGWICTDGAAQGVITQNGFSALNDPSTCGSIQ